MKYQTILFDLDGTLIDTNDLIMTSFLYTLNLYYPGKYTIEDLIPHMGEPLYDQMVLFGPERPDELVQVYREHNERVHDELVKEFPGVHETLERLAEKGLKMGVVTSKLRRTAEMGLRLFGFDKYMDSFVCYQDTKQHKPDPAPLLLAMNELGAKPEDTLMVGDSQYDILAAHNTGVDSAGVAWSWKGADFLQSYSPTYMLNDMKDLIAIVEKSRVQK